MKILVLSLLLSALLPAAAKTIYVSVDGLDYQQDRWNETWYLLDQNGNQMEVGDWAGSSPETAFSRWGDAICFASDGDVVLVGPGVYREDSVRLQGYYDYSIEIRSENGPETTIFEGDIDGLDQYGKFTLSGITFMNAWIWGDEAERLIMENCVIKDNRYWDGNKRQSGKSGAMVLYWGNTSPISGATLKNCIVENITGDGGALEYCILFNCIVRNNRGLYAGGMYDCTAYNTLIVGNHAVRAEPDWVNSYDGWGGAATDCTLVNCTVVGNVADAGAGGVRNCKVMNSIVVGNRLANGSGSNWSNSSTFYSSCTTGSPSGSGNIIASPRFADSDYRLAAGSPGIDAGSNSYVYGTEDLDGFQRIYGSRVDMGAYEYVGRKTCVVSFDPNGGSVSLDSIRVAVGSVLGNLPIPFRYGWTFEGWYDDPDGGSLVTAQTAASGRNMYLYARWSAETDSVWQPVYRFYSKSYKGHFYTIDPEERATLMCTNPNWRYEGVAYYAATEQVQGTVPLHRFYSKNYRGHFFTVDEDEMWTLRNTNPNWRYEGVAFYVYPSRQADPSRTATAIYRFWSKGYRHHFFTIDEDEMWTLRETNPNWKYEGVAFYAFEDEP